MPPGATALRTAAVRCGLAARKQLGKKNWFCPCHSAVFLLGGSSRDVCELPNQVQIVSLGHVWPGTCVPRKVEVWDKVVRIFYSPAVLVCAMVIQVLKNHGKALAYSKNKGRKQLLSK